MIYLSTQLFWDLLTDKLRSTVEALYLKLPREVKNSLSQLSCRSRSWEAGLAGLISNRHTSPLTRLEFFSNTQCVSNKGEQGLCVIPALWIF